MIDNIDIRGLKEVSHSLDKFRAGLSGEVETEIGKRLERVIKAATVYPATRPNQKYKRTFTFKRAWRVTKIGTMSFRITNNAAQRGRSYGSYVMGDADKKGQAGIHVGRWKLIRTVIDDELDTMQKELDLKIENYAKKQGL